MNCEVALVWGNFDGCFFFFFFNVNEATLKREHLNTRHMHNKRRLGPDLQGKWSEMTKVVKDESLWWISGNGTLPMQRATLIHHRQYRSPWLCVNGHFERRGALCSLVSCVSAAIKLKKPKSFLGFYCVWEWIKILFCRRNQTFHLWSHKQNAYVMH